MRKTVSTPEGKLGKNPKRSIIGKWDFRSKSNVQNRADLELIAECKSQLNCNPEATSVELQCALRYYLNQAPRLNYMYRIDMYSIYAWSTGELNVYKRNPQGDDTQLLFCARLIDETGTS